MKLRHKIGLGLLGTLVVAIAALGVTLGYDAECTPPSDSATKGERMQAIRYRCYGGPEVLRLEDAPRPVPGEGQVLVRVQAAGVNPLDWHFMRGKPYLMRLLSGIGRPKDSRLGVDFAGTVEAVGPGTTQFAPGDEVFGGSTGAYAEYLVVGEERTIVRRPANVPPEQAATVAIAGITALQGLRDKGRLEAGDKVLINGASGGVGTFAVQIAKAMGAEVTGVCSTRNLEMVRSIGADHVIDYTRESFIEGDRRYDLILDMVGNHSLLDTVDALEPDGVLVRVGDADSGDWIDPLLGALGALIVSPFISQDIVGFIARLDRADLQILADLMAEGRLTPVIGQRYSLQEVPDAIRHSEEGHAQGKIVVAVNQGL
jgi:NADPH:quinone reductase-like Zn-dependent oxidoreductase